MPNDYQNLSRKELIAKIGELESILAQVEDGSKIDAEDTTIEHPSVVYFEKILKTAPMGILKLVDREIVFLNDFACKILGYTAEELSGQNTRMLYFNDEEYEQAAQVYEQMKKEGVGTIETTFRAKNGKAIHCILNGIPLDPGSQANGILFTVLDITSLKKSQKEAKESKQLLYSLINGIHESILLLDKDGKVLFINEEGATRNNTTPEKMIGKEVFSFMPEKVGKIRKHYFQEILQTADPLQFVDRRPNGREYDNLVYPIFNSDDEISSVAVIAQDITERHRAEQSLLNTKNMLEALIEASPLPMFDLDQEGKVSTIWNSAAEKIFGWNRKEVMGKAVPLIPEQHSERFNEICDEIGGGSSIMEVELVCVQKSGSTLDVSMSGAPVRNAAGDVVGIMVILVDVTERKQAERQLQKFKLGIERSGEAIFTTDADGVIEYVNPTFTKIYGYTKQEAIGRTPRLIQSGQYRDVFYEQFWQNILQKKVVVREIVNKTKSGEVVTVQSSTNPILDREGDILGFLAIQRDITEQKQLEEQFRQAQKMESIGRLAGGVAHDLNNLLTPIRGYAELLTIKIREDTSLLGYAQQIHHAADRAKDLTQQLLAFGRKQTLKMEEMNIAEGIRKFESILRQTIREDIDLKFDLDEEDGYVKIDQSQIGQVLMNLAINAQDAMVEGGVLTVETANIELNEEYTRRHPELEPGRYVLVTVSDTGEGIDKETIPHIFEPFFTTKSDTEGTGLGLATVYGIVKQHKGHISVYSEIGYGTTFRIYLPRIESIEQEKQVVGQTTRKYVGDETILITEDDDMVRNYVASLLIDQGYKLLEASNAEVALGIVEEQGEEIELLITDVIMPQVNGRDLYEKVSQLYPDMRVLFISGYTNEVIAKHGMLEPDVNFLQKPFSNKQLTEMVRQILDA